MKCYKMAILALLLFCFALLPMKGQVNGLVQGKLDNGLTYYILRDVSNGGEANFYLYQNVGAILERPDQYGLAHFVEHMSFTSTEHFPNGVMEYLLNEGLVFNAQTGLNETRFQVNNVPANNKEVMQNMYWLLRDWCHGLAMKPADVAKEADIISEEWRQTRTPEKRLSEAIAPTIYNGSSYAMHNVIGSESIIRGYKAKNIKEFYEEWYRPELQCVVIIGDIDPQACEQEVKKVFGSLKVSKKSVVRTPILIPDNSSPLYGHYTAPDNGTASFGLYQRCFVETNPQKRDVAGELVKARLFQRLASQQLALLRNDGVEEFIAASITYSPLVRLYNQVAWDVVPYAGKEKEALRQILAVRERIRRAGFTESEFERIKEAMYNEMKPIVSQDNLGTPDNWMEVFKQNYLYGMPIETFGKQIREQMEALVDMEVDDLNVWVKSWMNDKNLSFITYSPNKDMEAIGLDEFSKTLDDVAQKPVLAFEKPKSINTLIDFDITSGKVVKTEKLEDLNVTRWTLSNGAQVLYKYLPSTDSRFYFVGSAVGGTSSVNPIDIPSEKAMQGLVMKAGVYKYNRNQLFDWLSNKGIQLSLSIDDYTDGIGGNVGADYAEDFFQYLYLVLNKQNFDRKLFDRYVERSKYILASRSAYSRSAIDDSIKALLYPPSPENPMVDAAYYSKMKFEDLQRLYNEHFGNAAQFTFCLVGALKEDEARKMIEKYVASLPGDSKAGTRHIIIRDASSKEKDIMHVFEADMEGDASEIELSYLNDVALDSLEQGAFKIAKDLLQSRLFEELREKDGGVYSVGVEGSYAQVPTASENLSIHFTTERSKTEQMKRRAKEVIDEVVSGKFSDDAFKKIYVPLVVDQEAARKAEAKQSETSMEEENPLMWIAILNAYVESKQGHVQEKPVTLDYSKVTRSDVVRVMQKIIGNARKRDITVMPRIASHNDF